MVALQYRELLSEGQIFEEDFDVCGNTGKVNPCRIGRSGTWATVIEDGHAEENVQTVDFLCR